jgi:integrase
MYSLVKFLCYTSVKLDEALGIKIKDIGDRKGENVEVKIRGRFPRTVSYTTKSLNNIFLVYDVGGIDSPLFRSERRKDFRYGQLTKANVSQRIKKVAKEAGTPNVTAVNIRYTGILTALEQAMDQPFDDQPGLDELADCLGMKLSTLERAYLPAFLQMKIWDDQ